MSTITEVAAPATLVAVPVTAPRLHVFRRVLALTMGVVGITLFAANAISIWVTGGDLLGRFQF